MRPRLTAAGPASSAHFAKLMGDAER